MPVSKLLLALLSAAFMSTVAAQLLDNIVTRVNSERQVEFCTLDPSVTVLHCSNSDGDPVPSDNGRMPAMTVCLVANERGGTSVMACLKNGFKVKTRQTPSERGQLPVDRFFQHKRNARSIWAPLIAAVPDLICKLWCKKDKGPPPNQPPTLTCASLEGSSPVTASKGELEAVVSWTTPTATDPEDGDLDVVTVPEMFVSGERYRAGHYSVAFYAKDGGGGADQCGLTFQVEVITCGHPGWPKNGRLNCQDHFTAYGRGCSIVCDAGYELPEESVKSIECTDSKTWDNQIPDCKPVSCKPKPTVPNGDIQCPKGAFFDKLCAVVCNDGYSISGGYFVDCDKEGAWPETFPQCKDATAPVFTYCPDPIQVAIDAPDNTANVEWDDPRSSDNAGEPKVKERNGKIPGRYDAGKHFIIYDIEDIAGNKGQSCEFNVDVQSISCDPPDLDIKQGKEHMKYNCPDFYRFGAECSLACKSGYPLVGVKKIKCLNVANSNPPDLQWTWDQSELEPYCKVSRCSDLDAPANGALACDQWEYGNTCQMQCQQGFDVPYLPQGGGLFVCSTTNGKWIPNTDPPDCVVHDGRSDLKMGADMFYYTGVCNSSAANLKQIQENFIKALNSSVYRAVCVGHDKCQSRFVSVVCGPKSVGRRRRDAMQDIENQELEEFNTEKDEAHNIEKRQTEQAYKIVFELILSIDKSNTDTAQATKDSENVLYDMFDKIRTEVGTGKFDIAGLDTRGDSLGIGSAQLDCAPGMQARIQTASCVGCGYGRFYNSSTKDCDLCPIGTYQDQAHALSCISCPEKSTTLYTSSRNSSQCLRYCEPGEYSATGLAPCGKCPSNKYQPGYRQINCTACHALKRSEVMGATGQHQCQDYDVQLKLGKPVNVKNITKTSNTVSVVTWLYMTSTSGLQTLTSVESSDEEFKWSILYNTEVVIVMNGVKETTDIRLQPNKWTQFAFTVDANANTVTVYINGNVAHTATSFTIPRAVAPADKLFIDADVQLSNYQMASLSFTSKALQAASSTCHFSVPETFVSIDDLAKSQNAKSVVPSKCDAVDECVSSPCGGHGMCTNLQGGFKCTCTGGYTGSTCTESPDPCLANFCTNGAVCVNAVTSYTCDCTPGYRGQFCEIKAVDGKWSSWSDWSECSRWCGGGNSSRSRACDSPAPDPEGKPCDGDTTETRDCNENITCPECLSLRRPRGASSVECNTTETLTRCRIQCQDGHELPVDSQPYYDCGAVTNYTWSHQKRDNPRARLPACSEVKAPGKLGFTSTTKYGGLACQDEAGVKQQLNEKLESTPCGGSSARCTFGVTTTCKNNGRRKRNTGSLDVTVSIKSKDLPSGIDILEFFKNNTVSDELRELVQTIYNIEVTAQEMLNDTSTFYNVTVNGVQYRITEKPEIHNNITCQPGSAPFSVFCIESPVGSFADGLTVTMCSKGTYQDETGSTSCKQCPSGFTTLEPGAENVGECSVEDNSTVTTPTSVKSTPTTPTSVTTNQTTPTSVTKNQTTPISITTNQTTPTSVTTNQTTQTSVTTTQTTAPSVKTTQTTPTNENTTQTTPTSGKTTQTTPTSGKTTQTTPASVKTTQTTATNENTTQTTPTSVNQTPTRTQSVDQTTTTQNEHQNSQPASSSDTSANTAVIASSIAVGLVIIIGIIMIATIVCLLAQKRKREKERLYEDLQHDDLQNAPEYNVCNPEYNVCNPAFYPEKVTPNLSGYDSRAYAAPAPKL